ncbi:MAG: ThiF family adenylyltransferase [Longimicrobiales bacterium]|nr:ThiF family adenylyltransferase [Longimicrobiales bacterium]
MQNNNYTNQSQDNDYEIAIIGAGGIGGHLLSVLVPALHRGELLESTKRISLRVYDSDEVTKENLAHQRFNYNDVGMHKVTAIERSLCQFTGDRLRLVACPWDVRDASDMTPADLIVVAVDSAVARLVAHSSGTTFLDLRCLGDGYIAFDSTIDPDFVTSMTPDQPARSCQHEDAISSGNIEFGFLIAAAHGAQWVLQSLRWMTGQTLAMPPYAQTANITFGTLSRLPEAEEKLEPQGCVKPKIHPSNLIDSCIDTDDYDSGVVREHIAGLAKNRRWQDIWKIGDQILREVSVLIDAEDKIYIDIGTSGEVKMAPPEGAKVPFNLWIHSHPRDAYWSSTDRDTIGCYTGLLQRAVVLGHDHYKMTRHAKSPEASLEPQGSLSSWTSEPTVFYADDPKTLSHNGRIEEDEG